MEKDRPATFAVKRPFSRRDFLRRTGWLAAAAMTPKLLAACSPSNGEGIVGETAPDLAEIGGELNYLSWEGYDMREATAAWREEVGIDLQSAYIGTADDIPAQVLSPGGQGLDVITYFYGNGRHWKERDILSTFNRAEVPNLDALFPEFQESQWWQLDSGEYFGVPFTWLSWPLSYRSDLVDTPRRWADLFEDEFAGRVAMVDDPVAIITTAAIVNGFEPDSMTADELDEVKGWLLRMRESTRTIAASYGDLLNLLVTGDAVAAFPGWQAFNVWGADQGAAIDFVNPDDGFGMSIDVYAVPPTTDNRDTALAWLNQMISPEVQAAVATELFTGVTNPAALDQIPDEVAALYPYDDIGSVLSEDRLYEVPWRDEEGKVQYEDWLSMWNEVQSA